MTSNLPLPPARGAEEHFDKAKKHLWASDAPTGELNRPHRHAEHARSDMDSSVPHRDEWHSSRSSGEIQSKTRPEALECILKPRSSRAQYTLPPLTREAHITDHDPRSTFPRSWKPMDREPEERSFARPRMSGHASRGHEGRMQRPVSLSVFNSPTATYMWPGFQAASQMDHPPVIYVNYEREPTRSASNSVSSQQDSPIILPHPLSRHDRSVSTLLPRKRRSSSPAGRALPAESSSVVKILEPLRRVHLVETPARSLPSMKHQQGDCTASPPRESPQSSSEHGRQPSPSVPYTYRHESSPSTSDASDPSSSVPPTIHRASPKGDPEEWEQYARPTTSPDGTSRKWLCTWVTVDSDKRINCCYMSKKQLVKRHVETTHLRYKPFVCEVCGKGFPQKTSLDTHMHGHTGSTPHECRYGCGMSFKDPARRHRHMVDEHGYVPRQSKKKHKSGQPPQDPSDFESLRPWNA